MEFLVWVVDKGTVGTEPPTGIGSYFNGDVIAAKPDGWAWSYDELHEDRWRVIRVAGVTQTQVDDFLAREDRMNMATNRHFWRRQYYLDWSQLTPASLAAQFVGPTPGVVIDLTLQQVVHIATQRAPL